MDECFEAILAERGMAFSQASTQRFYDRPGLAFIPVTDIPRRCCRSRGAPTLIPCGARFHGNGQGRRIAEPDPRHMGAQPIRQWTNARH